MTFLYLYNSDVNLNLSKLILDSYRHSDKLFRHRHHINVLIATNMLNLRTNFPISLVIIDRLNFGGYSIVIG